MHFQDVEPLYRRMERCIKEDNVEMLMATKRALRKGLESMDGVEMREMR